MLRLESAKVQRLEVFIVLLPVPMRIGSPVVPVMKIATIATIETIVTIETFILVIFPPPFHIPSFHIPSFHIPLFQFFETFYLLLCSIFKRA